MWNQGRRKHLKSGGQVLKGVHDHAHYGLQRGTFAQFAKKWGPWPSGPPVPTSLCGTKRANFRSNPLSPAGSRQAWPYGMYIEGVSIQRSEKSKILLLLFLLFVELLKQEEDINNTYVIL